MKCPKCTTDTFASFAIREVTVERCDTCGGIWFDEWELSQILKESPELLTSLRGGGEREDLDAERGHCPHDATPLLRIYSTINRSVVVDTCLQCRGIWLDVGEFEKLLSAGGEG
jgi:Zn-finger nucleic acid-binding protein